MAAPIRLGARVAMAEDQTPTGFSFYDFEDSSGHRWTKASPPGVNLDVTPFVELDDGRRIVTETLGITMGLHDRGELEEEIHEAIFEDDIREVAEFDPEVAEMPLQLDEIADELSRRGMPTGTAALRELPFQVELDATVETVLEPR